MMKYYQEYANAEKTKIWLGYILAFDDERRMAYGILDSDANLYGYDRGVGEYYIQHYCEEISGQMARAICPELFAYLEKEGVLHA